MGKRVICMQGVNRQNFLCVCDLIHRIMARPNSSESSSSSRRASIDHVSPLDMMDKEALINDNDEEDTGSSLSSVMGVKLDPHQMVILSGPFPSDDHKSNILIARPIPRGYTVIAKPIIGAPPAQLLLRRDQITKIDRPKLSLSSSDESVANVENKDKALTNPMVMMWSAEYPEGRLVPLRQPAPPVYFQSQK